MGCYFAEIAVARGALGLETGVSEIIVQSDAPAIDHAARCELDDAVGHGPLSPGAWSEDFD
ncbi:MAG: hypothetical protein ABH891_06690 [Candidatus Omnitrophota bacterium]